MQVNVWEVIRIWRLKERHGIESDPSLSAWYMRQVALTAVTQEERKEWKREDR